MVRNFDTVEEALLCLDGEDAEEAAEAKDWFVRVARWAKAEAVRTCDLVLSLIEEGDRKRSPVPAWMMEGGWDEAIASYKGGEK